MEFEIIEPSQGAKIKVIGMGGAGGNAVNNMIKAELTGVDFIVANTDLQDLERSQAPVKIQIGCELTRGLGAGGNPEVGRRAAEENMDAIRKCVTGADMVFLTAGLGGGTGTGAGPLVAEVAKEQGALTVAVVTKPFFFEGSQRMKTAEVGVEELKSRVDTLITIPNDRLLAKGGKNVPALETFKQADDVLLHAVRGISELITVPGHINPDFADLRRVMAERGLAIMGTGVASGDNRAVEAANRAISNPLLEDIAIDGARGVLLNITTGPDATMVELQDAATLIQKEAHGEAVFILGWVVDENIADEFRVTVIAAGIGSKEESVSRPDMTVVREEAIAELGGRLAQDDLDWPTYLRDERQVEPEAQTSPASRVDLSDREIPTFLRRAAD